ncbi:MAG: hypothetical protein Q9222_007495, partial [Ikaeria aurantiellina]
MNHPPEYFYRVQHQNSFTNFHPAIGFKANAHYSLDHLDHWLHKRSFERHLDPNDKPALDEDPTPFISVYDNWRDACREAQDYHLLGRQNIFIAQIDTDLLRPTVITFRVRRRTYRLQMQLSVDGIRYFDIKALQHELSVSPRDNQTTEWLAADIIPEDHIHRIIPWPMNLPNGSAHNDPADLTTADLMHAPSFSRAYYFSDGTTDMATATAGTDDVPGSANIVTNGHTGDTNNTTTTSNAIDNTSHPSNPSSGYAMSNTQTPNDVHSRITIHNPLMTHLPTFTHPNSTFARIEIPSEFNDTYEYLEFLFNDIGVDTESS